MNLRQRASLAVLTYLDFKNMCVINFKKKKMKLSVSPCDHLSTNNCIGGKAVRSNYFTNLSSYRKHALKSYT